MEQKNLATGDHNNNDDLDDGAAGIQLFTALFDVKSASFTFNFTVHFTGIVDSYRVRQMDGLTSQQLWSSVTDQQDDGTNFKLISSDGSCFSVHKWVLGC